MAFEVPYYVMFGLWYFVRTLRWRLAAVALLVAAGPYITLLFSLWLLGFGCYRFTRTATLTRGQGRALLLASCLASLPLLYWSVPYHATFFLAGVPFAASIVGFAFSSLSLALVARPVRWIAGATFTLYLIHYPIGVLLHAVLPPSWALGLRWAVICTVVLAATFLLAEFTERRKDQWRRGIALLIEYSTRRGNRSAVLAR